MYCVVTIGVLAISPEIIKVVGAKDYWEGIPMVMWVVYATFINFAYTLYVNVEFFYKKNNANISWNNYGSYCQCFFEYIVFKTIWVSVWCSVNLGVIFGIVVFSYDNRQFCIKEKCNRIMLLL